MDPGTALQLARTLQASTGLVPSADLLANYYQSNAPGTSLDEALSAARTYLGQQQPAAPGAAPAGPQPADPGSVVQPQSPDGGPGNVGFATGAPAFGDPATLGQAVGQAKSGPVGSALGPLGTAGFNSLMSAILTGSLTGANPLAALTTFLSNQAGKFGAQGTPSGFADLSIGDVLSSGLLGDPIASQFFDFSAPSNLAALGISSAEGRSASAGTQAGGVGLTGVEGLTASPSLASGRSGDTGDTGGGQAPGPSDSGLAGPSQGIEGATTGPTGAPSDSGAPSGGGAATAGGEFHSGGPVTKTGPANLEAGEYVINKRAAKGKRGALEQMNTKGLQKPFESLDDLLTRARAFFDVGGTPGPGLPSQRGPR